MISQATARFLRIPPRKARLVLDLIRGKGVDEAANILTYSNTKAARLVSDVLDSAVANAKRLPHVKEDDLYISFIQADGGPMLKRFRAATMGRAGSVLKRTSHILIQLDLKESKLVKKVAPKEAVHKQPKNKTTATENKPVKSAAKATKRPVKKE